MKSILLLIVGMFLLVGNSLAGATSGGVVGAGVGSLAGGVGAGPGAVAGAGVGAVAGGIAGFARGVTADPDTPAATVVNDAAVDGYVAGALSGAGAAANTARITITESRAAVVACGGLCFAEGTLVAAPNGDVKIEDIKVGDTVWAYDFATGTSVERKVTELKRNFTHYWVDVQVDGETIQATRGHPFWVESEKRWVEAADLKAGMSVRLLDGTTRVVSGVNVREVQEPETTYNFEVETDHNYFVGTTHVLVHNPYPISPQYPPPTPVGGNFHFNFDTSPGYANSRNMGVQLARNAGAVGPTQIGHHINSVQTHPHLAAEPSNIQAVPNRPAHLNAHGGNWRTPTSGSLRPGC